MKSLTFLLIISLISNYETADFLSSLMSSNFKKLLHYFKTGQGLGVINKGKTEKSINAKGQQLSKKKQQK